MTRLLLSWGRRYEPAQQRRQVVVAARGVTTNGAHGGLGRSLCGGGRTVSHHWDYGPNKTKAERRERAGEKKKERMDQGKRVKAQQRLIEERAAKAAKESDERAAREAGKAK